MLEENKTPTRPMWIKGPPPIDILPKKRGCRCKQLGVSNARWQVGNSFEAVSFNIRHFQTEEIHAAITLYDDASFKSILRHLLKRKGIV